MKRLQTEKRKWVQVHNYLREFASSESRAAAGTMLLHQAVNMAKRSVRFDYVREETNLAATVIATIRRRLLAQHNTLDEKRGVALALADLIAREALIGGVRSAQRFGHLKYPSRVMRQKRRTFVDRLVSKIIENLRGDMATHKVVHRTRTVAHAS